LTRLIDLTADVRTTVQSNFRPKVPKVIKKGIEDFIIWAARDGGYSHLKYVPNLMVWVVPRRMDHDRIDAFMQTRMRSLARLQREYLRADRAPDFWKTTASPFLGPKKAMGTQFSKKYAPYSPIIKKEWEESSLMDLEPVPNDLEKALKDTSSEEKAPQDTKSQPSPNSKDELKKRAHDNDRPKSRTLAFFGSRDRPRTPPKPTFRRQPPVVYGLFIVGTSVFLLTLDSAKGDAGYVSFHLELNFLDSHQSVWNGLTLAIAICLARDELMSRRDDFETLPAHLEGDPDA
jgi:hypothetical protein